MRVTKVLIDPSKTPKYEDVTRHSCFLGCAHVTLDGMLTIRNIKIIQPQDKPPFLDFPSRPLPATDVCISCKREVPSNAAHCMRCGAKVLTPNQPQYMNMVYPVTRACRVMIHDAVMTAYRQYRSFEISKTEDNPNFTPDFGVIEEVHNVT